MIKRAVLWDEDDSEGSEEITSKQKKKLERLTQLVLRL